MPDFIVEEIKEALLVMAYGMALTFSYDLLRIIRRIIKHCNVAVSVEDIIFWLFVSYTTLVFIIKIDDGGLRIYFFIGLICGITLYKTVSKFILKKLTELFTIRKKKRGAPMSHRSKKSNVFIAGFITVAVIAICIFFKFKVKDIKAENDAGDKKIEQLENELAAEKQRTEELETYSKYVNTKQFVEFMARNKLGLVYPNEVIFRPEDD